MLRLLSNGNVRRAINAAVSGTRICSSRNYIWGPRYPLSSIIRNLDRQLQDVERQFERVVWNSRDWADCFRPVGAREHPSQVEAFRIQNPIIEEDGVKKFLLELDVRRFKPDEVMVKTNAKENTLTIEAKHKDDQSKFEYARKLTLPEGVVIKDMTCQFTSEGILQIRAPYNGPKEADVADVEIPVKHE